MFKTTITGSPSKLILSLLLIAFSANAQAAAATPSKGTTIGTMVKDAITAAFPGISSIVNLIWGANPNQNKKAADATNTLSSTTSTKALQTSAQDQAKPLIQPVKTVADELDVVEKFAEASSLSMPHLVAMQTMLSQSPQSATLAKDLTDEWGLASDTLTILFSDGITTQIATIRDPAVQAQLLNIHNAKTQVAGRLANRLKGAKTTADLGNLAELKDLTVALTGLLTGAQSLAAAELNILQQDMASLANWASGKAQGGRDTINPKQNLLDFAQQEVAAANKVVSGQPQ